MVVVIPSSPSHNGYSQAVAEYTKDAIIYSCTKEYQSTACDKVCTSFIYTGKKEYVSFSTTKYEVQVENKCNGNHYQSYTMEWSGYVTLITCAMVAAAFVGIWMFVSKWADSYENINL